MGGGLEKWGLYVGVGSDLKFLQRYFTVTRNIGIWFGISIV